MNEIAKGIVGVPAALLFALCGMPAEAAGEDEWEVTLSPYLWGSRMHGEVGVGRLPSAEVDMSFGDILEQLDGGFMGAAEVRKGRWGMIFDTLYMNTSTTASHNGLSGEAGVRQTQLTGLLAWRWQEGVVPLDLLAGVRHMRLSESLTLSGPQGTLSQEQDAHWTEPVVGMRARWIFAPDWSLWGSGDVSGFGVGSDLALQAIVGVSYNITPSLSAELGARWIKVDYDKDALRYDVVNDGVFIGASYRF